MILKGVYGATLFLTFITFVWAAPRGVGVGSSPPEKVQKSPSVRSGSSHSTWIWIGGGGK